MSKDYLSHYLEATACRPLSDLRKEGRFQDVSAYEGQAEDTCVPRFWVGTISILVAGNDASPMMEDGPGTGRAPSRSTNRNSQNFKEEGQMLKSHLFSGSSKFACNSEVHANSGLPLRLAATLLCVNALASPLVAQAQDATVGNAASGASATVRSLTPPLRLPGENPPDRRSATARCSGP